MEQALHRQMGQHRQASRTSVEDVPFGIRAIESGIEIEGVWISRSNTPEPVSRETSGASSIWNYVPHKGFDGDLENHGYTDNFEWASRSSYSNDDRSENHELRRTLSSGTISNHHSSCGPSLEDPIPIPIPKPLKAHYPPLTLAKYTDAIHQINRNSSSKPSGDVHESSTSNHTQGNFEVGGSGLESDGTSAASTSSSSEGGLIAASAPLLLNTDLKAPKTQSIDLDLMQSHRISQAAETGQLTPRIRKPLFNDHSMSSFKLPQPAITSNLPTRIQQRPASLSSVEQDLPSITSFSNPKIDALPPAIRRSSIPDAPSFAQFCQVASASPRPESYKPTGSASNASSADNTLRNTLLPCPTNMATNKDSAPTLDGAAAQNKRTSFEKSEPDVLRGLGTGFEILKPGTLSLSLPTKSTHEKPRTAPPISLQNYGPRTRSSSTDNRRKLQKKPRSSIDSTASSDMGKSRASIL